MKTLSDYLREKKDIHKKTKELLDKTNSAFKQLIAEAENNKK